MSHIIPLLILMLVCMWYEESIPWERIPIFMNLPSTYMDLLVFTRAPSSMLDEFTEARCHGPKAGLCLIGPLSSPDSHTPKRIHIAIWVGAHWVPSPLRSIYAILAFESMKVGIYHFTGGPKY